MRRYDREPPRSLCPGPPRSVKVSACGRQRQLRRRRGVNRRSAPYQVAGRARAKAGEANYKPLLG